MQPGKSRSIWLLGEDEVAVLAEFHRGRFAALVFGAGLFCRIAVAGVAEIAGECDECHGSGGVSSEGDVPSIAGISPFILEEYMLEYHDKARICRETKYRSGDTERPVTDMCTVARDLSKADITEIARFYGSKKFVAAAQEFDASKAAAGASVHKRLCEKCHTDGGSYADDDASILAGQWMPYLEQALADHIDGDRNMLDEKMKEKTDQLSAGDAEALMHYYGSQQ